MRRYQKWLSMGLLALTPHIALADELDSPAATEAPPAAARAKKVSANQELAERVAKTLRDARLNKYEIDIDVRSGIVTLVGSVVKPEQKAAAEKAVSAVPGVTRVVNRLEVSEKYTKSDVRQAEATMPRSPIGSSQYISRTNGQRDPSAGLGPNIEGAEPTLQTVPPRVVYNNPPQQQLQSVPQSAPQQYCPPGMGGQNGYPAGGMPNGYPAGGMPNGAYQGYGTQGPQQAASAYPYIGPYYPYPQIPLGWRKASLEWDDGYWNLNFRSRTDKWWWYLNPQNWDCRYFP
jgi:hypothetical protein